MMSPHHVISVPLPATAKTPRPSAARRRLLATFVLGLAVSSPAAAGARLKIKTPKIFTPLQSAAGQALDTVKAAADKTLAAARAEAERLGAHVSRYLKDPTTPVRDAVVAARSETTRLQNEVKRLDAEVARVTRVQAPEFVTAQVRHMRQSLVLIQVPDIAQVGGALPEFPTHLTTDMRRTLTEGTLVTKALDFATLGKAAAAAARHTEKTLIQNPASTFDRQFNRALETAGDLRQEALATARREMEAAKNVAEAIARDPARIADEAKTALRTMYTAGNRQELRGYYDKAGNWVKAAEGELTEQTRAGVRTFVTLGNQQILTGYYDKSGRWVKQNEKMLITIAVVAALSATPGGQTLAGQMLIAGMQAYYTSNGDLKATAIAMATSGAFFGIGTIGLEQQGLVGTGAKIAMHGTIGGASRAANGGSFQEGFIAAAVSQGAASSGAYDAIGDNVFAQTAAAGIVGGTAAEASGGKFEDGALVAAMSHIANEAARSETAAAALAPKEDTPAGALATAAGVVALLPAAVSELALILDGLMIGTAAVVSASVTHPSDERLDVKGAHPPASPSRNPETVVDPETQRIVEEARRPWWMNSDRGDVGTDNISPASSEGMPTHARTERRHPLTKDVRGHILDGDDAGGGHRPGTGKAGKTEFPADWSDEQIIKAIEDVAAKPDSVHHGRDGREVHTGTRNGVDIRVIIETPKGGIEPSAGYYIPGNGIVTGFPTNLPRNPR